MTEAEQIQACISLAVPWTTRKNVTLDDIIKESRRLDIIPSIASQLTANVSANTTATGKDGDVRNRLIKMAEQEIALNHLA